MVKQKNNLFKRRIIDNTNYSIQGLKSTFRNEEAFRIEVFLSIFLIPIGFYFGQNGVQKALLIGSVLIVLIVEMLNSAIENIVDRISTQKHKLSKRAKDQGSASVFLSLMLVVITWILVLFY